MFAHFDISKNIFRHLESGLDRILRGRLFPTPRIRETAFQGSPCPAHEAFGG